jgi:hypothetical protein
MSEVTIYVWKPKYNNSFLAFLEASLKREEPSQKNVGHAALKIDNTYVSVHPTSTDESFLFMPLPQSHPYLTVEAEIQTEGPPSYVRTIDWLNTESMLAAWDRFRKDCYNLSWASCSGICKSLLLRGVNLSETSERVYPQAYEFFSKYMTDSVNAAKNAPKILNDYPEHDLYRAIALEYYNRREYWRGVSIDLRTAAMSINSSAELFATPMDIIQIAKILNSDVSKAFRE